MPTKMSACRVLLWIMLALLAGGRPAAAATYSVATDGDDSNPGTEAKPWKTLQHASDSAKPGDTVLIGAGLYSPARGTWNVKCVGTAEAPITFKARGNGEVRISASTVLPPDGWKPYKGAIYQIEVGPPVAGVFQNGLPLVYPWKNHNLTSVETMYANSFYKKGSTLYVWLADGADPRNFQMRIAPSRVISLDGCASTLFDGLTLEFAYEAIKQAKESHHVTIRNCIVRSMANQGILGAPFHFVIEKNLFQKIGSGKHHHGLYASTPGVIVRNNTFEEISGAAIHEYSSDGNKGSGGWEISGNVFRNPREFTTPKGKGGYYVELILWARDGNQVSGNEFHGEDKRSGVSLRSSNNRIYNNKFIRCRTTIDPGNGSGNEVRDNVIEK